CVQILDCPDVADIDYDTCVTYEVYEGTLDVTVNDDEDTGPFEATLTNARAREVTIDTDTFVSTPVEDGRIWCIDSYTIEVRNEAPRFTRMLSASGHSAELRPSDGSLVTDSGALPPGERESISWWTRRSSGSVPR